MKNLKQINKNNSKLVTLLKYFDNYKQDFNKITKEIGKLLSKLLLLNYINKMPFVSPIWSLIRILTKWSIYTSILSYLGNLFIGLMQVDLSIPYLIPSLSSFISATYLLFTELNMESLYDINFSLKNTYNKFLSKIIRNIENSPNKTPEDIKKINQIRDLYSDIPKDKIDHIPSDIKNRIIQMNPTTPTSYIYTEYEKYLQDPNYLRKRWREYLISNQPKVSNINNYQVPTEAGFFSSFYNYLFSTDKIVALGLTISLVVFNHFFPKEYDTAKNAIDKVSEHLRVKTYVMAIINFFRKGRKPDNPDNDGDIDIVLTDFKGNSERVTTDSCVSEVEQLDNRNDKGKAKEVDTTSIPLTSKGSTIIYPPYEETNSSTTNPSSAISERRDQLIENLRHQAANKVSEDTNDNTTKDTKNEPTLITKLRKIVHRNKDDSDSRQLGSSGTQIIYPSEMIFADDLNNREIAARPHTEQDKIKFGLLDSLRFPFSTFTNIEDDNRSDSSSSSSSNNSNDSNSSSIDSPLPEPSGEGYFSKEFIEAASGKRAFWDTPEFRNESENEENLKRHLKEMEKAKEMEDADKYVKNLMNGLSDTPKDNDQNKDNIDNNNKPHSIIVDLIDPEKVEKTPGFKNSNYYKKFVEESNNDDQNSLCKNIINNTNINTSTNTSTKNVRFSDNNDVRIIPNDNKGIDVNTLKEHSKANAEKRKSKNPEKMKVIRTKLKELLNIDSNNDSNNNNNDNN